MISSLLFSLFIHVFIGLEVGVCAPIWFNLLPSLLSLDLLLAYLDSDSISVHIYFAPYSWFWCALTHVKSHMISSLLFSLIIHVFIGHGVGVCAPIWFNLAYFWICRLMDINLFPFYSMAANVLDIDLFMWNHDSTITTTTTTKSTPTPTTTKNGDNAAEDNSNCTDNNFFKRETRFFVSKYRVFQVRCMIKNHIISARRSLPNT